MKCLNCGFGYDEGSSCPMCGSTDVELPETEEIEQEQSPEINESNAEALNSDQSDEKDESSALPKKGGKGFFIILTAIICAVVTACSAVTYVLTLNKLAEIDNRTRSLQTQLVMMRQKIDSRYNYGINVADYYTSDMTIAGDNFDFNAGTITAVSLDTKDDKYILVFEIENISERELPVAFYEIHAGADSEDDWIEADTAEISSELIKHGEKAKLTVTVPRDDGFDADSITLRFMGCEITDVYSDYMAHEFEVFINYKLKSWK